MTIHVAIVGSGPAGFYTADALLRALDGDARVAVLDRLPCPYGLIRSGVAPDHQTTKRVTRAFERTARNPRVRFFGNVDVGRDVTVAELRERFDAVVLAVGAPHDRPLGIPGEDKAGVYGSAAFVGWYNGHPDFCDLAPDLDTEAAVVIGNGNVAIDAARVLVKTRDEMAESDLPDYAADAIEGAPLRDVHIVGRRGPLDAKFTNVELREMGKLAECAPVVNADDLPASADDVPDGRERRLKERNLATLREFASLTDGRRKRIHFSFFAKPVRVNGTERAESVTFERTRVDGGRLVATGQTFDVACGLVIAAIGYRSMPVEDVPFDEERGVFVSEGGRIDAGLYVVGWAFRGPTGVIASNRPDGVAIAERIAREVSGGETSGSDGLDALLRDRGVRAVSFDDWTRIEERETALARPPAPRCKLTTVADMLAVLDAPKR